MSCSNLSFFVVYPQRFSTIVKGFSFSFLTQSVRSAVHRSSPKQPRTIVVIFKSIYFSSQASFIIFPRIFSLNIFEKISSTLMSFAWWGFLSFILSVDWPNFQTSLPFSTASLWCPIKFWPRSLTDPYSATILILWDMPIVFERTITPKFLDENLRNVCVQWCYSFQKSYPSSTGSSYYWLSVSQKSDWSYPCIESVVVLQTIAVTSHDRRVCSRHHLSWSRKKFINMDCIWK